MSARITCDWAEIREGAYRTDTQMLNTVYYFKVELRNVTRGIMGRSQSVHSRFETRISANEAGVLRARYIRKMAQQQ
jgi:hypothetical protein